MSIISSYSINLGKPAKINGWLAYKPLSMFLASDSTTKMIDETIRVYL
jgi:hypothetical protein